MERQSLNTKVSQDIANVSNSLIQCQFTLMAIMSFGSQTALLSALTGWEISPEELLRAGERTFNLKRLFSCRCGISRKDDIIPELVPVPASGNYVPKGEALEQALDEYYDLRGWTRDGIPKNERLHALGIELA